MQTSILVDRDDYKQVVEEEQYLFVLSVLENLGIPLDHCFPESMEFKDFTLENKINLRNLLSKFSVLVLDDNDGGIKIFVEKELIAEWKKCRFELRQDPSAIDPRQKLFMVIYIDYWTLFEDHQTKE